MHSTGDIMPGDVVALYGAHFKGHKGGLDLAGVRRPGEPRKNPFLE